MFKIGDFSKLCRVPTSMLRYYADLGLLVPAHTDKFTSYRYYTADQLHRLNRILALRDLGLSLEQIKAMLDDDLSPEEIRGMLRLKQAEIRQRVEEEQARLDRVAARLKQIEQEKQMPTIEVALKQIQVQHVIAIREIIPTPVYVGTLFNQVFGALGANGIQPTHPPIALYHDEEFTLTNMDTEIAIPVPDTFNAILPLSEGRQLTPCDLPAIPIAACAIHADSYDLFEETYTLLGQWIAANGYRVIGSSREVYLIPAGQPSGPVTEIQWPVERVS